MSIEQTLAERGERYGDFTDHARIAQVLQTEMRECHPSGWHRLSAVQRQALTVIADKIARILSGDPNYADNWHDIQGYARLAEERLVTYSDSEGNTVRTACASSSSPANDNLPPCDCGCKGCGKLELHASWCQRRKADYHG